MATVQKPSQYSRGQVSALGILAELEAIEPILKKHQQEIQPKLTRDLSPVVKQLIPTLGVKGLTDENLERIIQEVAAEAARQTLEDVARIQTKEQTAEVAADSLTQTLITQPEIESKIKKSPEEIFEKVYKTAQNVTQNNQQTLEQAAVLGNLTEIAKLTKPNQDLLSVISDSAQQVIETQAPLARPETKERLKGSLGSYLIAYVDQLNQQLAKIPPGTLPSFDQLQKAKEAAHNSAAAKIGTSLAASKSSKELGTKIGYQNITSTLAQNLALTPPVLPRTSLNLPTGTSLVIGTASGRKSIISAALANDQERLAIELKGTNAQIENLKKQQSLSSKDRKKLFILQNYYARLVNAQAEHVKKQKRLQGALSLIAKPFNGNTLPFSQTVWNIVKPQGGYVAPAVLLYGRKFGSDIVLRRSAATLGLNFGVSFSLPKIPSLGMGKAISTRAIPALLAVSLGAGLFKRIIKTGATVLGGLGLYFLGLAQAALFGFAIGATVGGVAGAIGGTIVGAQIGATIGSIVPGIGTVVGGAVGGLIGGAIGFFGGSIIGGIAGGLIGYGLAAGSTVTLSTGIGMAAGATIGFAVGGPLGALVGAALGAAAGYLVANYIIPFVKGAFETITGGAGAGLTAGGGLLASFGSFLTGLASAAFNGLISLGGSAIGFFSGLGNSLLGALGVGGGSAAAAPAIAGIVGGSVTTIGTLSVIVGTVAATTFFTLATDEPTTIITPGENQYFSVVKTADPDRMPNSDLPRDIKYSIVLTAKGLRLTNIQISDEIRVQSKNPPASVTTDTSGQPVSPPCAATIPTELAAGQTWTCEFSIRAESNFADSVVANSITVRATPEGQAEVTDGTVATTVIGNPPTICAIFDIQGPWSQEERNNINTICTVLDRSTQVVSMLQRAGTISLIKVPEGSLGSGVCGTVIGGNQIKISCSMTPTSFAKYVIIHELGHVLGNYNNTLFASFVDEAFALEGLMPTYPFGGSGADESFAEMFTEYVVSKEYNHPPRSWSNYPGGPWVNPGNGYTTFPNDRPTHYNFAKNQIFGGIEY